MAFERLGSITKRVVSRLEIGEGSVAAAPVPDEKAPEGVTPPASATGQRQNGRLSVAANSGQEDNRVLPIGRDMITAAPKRTRRAPARSAVIISLAMYRERRHAAAPF